LNWEKDNFTVQMIARFWHGRTKSSDAEQYRQYVKETGIRELVSTPGNLGAQIWQKKEDNITHIWVVSWWQDYESIKAFAGNDIAVARYYQDDKNYLLELEPHVLNCEAFDFKPSY
jgi:heme-degrading monooxygenase HmoA